MIIGTAGHIDHGKTSLVRALTGIDTDRLKEEKARGITIDLGFAYKPAGDGGVLGFVDVPGHEKLVRNMLAGATGIDHVLLVVAADDGPMPQTLEHLAILDLLGLRRGIVALTKTDLASPARVDAVRAQMQSLLADTSLAGAEIVPVSTLTGAGIADLTARLDAAAHAPAEVRDGGHFRLAIDRSFSLAGVGTVATGTAFAGRVRIGDKLVVSPSGREVRVRGIHAQNAKADEGRAGQRLALNLAGVDKQEIERGDWLVAEALHAPTQRLDARLRVLPGEARALAHWTPVHLHLGATDVGARVVTLEGTAVEPGASARVHLQLDRPIAALHGDRFILRDQSALRTLAGGTVLDAFAPDPRRRKPQRLAVLDALEAPDAATALAKLLAQHPPGGVDLDTYTRQWNLRADDRDAVLRAVPHRVVAAADGTALAFAPAQLDAFATAITDPLAAHHRKQPDSPGLTQEQLQRLYDKGRVAAAKPGAVVFALLLRDLLDHQRVRRTGPHWHLPDHEASLQGAEKQLWERLKPWLDEGGIAPPKLSDMLMRDKTLRKDQVLRTLQRLERMGKVFAVGQEYFVQRHHMLQLAQHAQRLAQADPNQRLNLKELRQAVGMSRHLSEPLVEFFDAIGYTQRDAAGRHIKRDPTRIFGDG